jgi:hypothetical protein
MMAVGNDKPLFWQINRQIIVIPALPRSPTNCRANQTAHHPRRTLS